jgi:addiction module HigA family antidote
MKTKEDMLSQLTNGILTESMDIGTKQYQDFKLLIRSKVSQTSKEERIRIALLGLKYNMEDYLSKSGKSIRVGIFIKQFIKLIEVKQIELAEYLNMKPSNLSKILSGERRLNIELAIILEKLSNINAELWLRIQNQNELKEAQKAQTKRMSKYKLKELIK